MSKAESNVKLLNEKEVRDEFSGVSKIRKDWKDVSFKNDILFVVPKEELEESYKNVKNLHKSGKDIYNAILKMIKEKKGTELAKERLVFLSLGGQILVDTSEEMENDFKITFEDKLKSKKESIDLTKGDCSTLCKMFECCELYGNILHEQIIDGLENMKRKSEFCISNQEIVDILNKVKQNDLSELECRILSIVYAIFKKSYKNLRGRNLSTD